MAPRPDAVLRGFHSWAPEQFFPALWNLNLRTLVIHEVVDNTIDGVFDLRQDWTSDRWYGWGTCRSDPVLEIGS